MSFIPVELRTIILGKLPVNERYKALHFSRKIRDTYNRRSRSFLLHYYKYRHRSPNIDLNTSLDYVIDFGATNLHTPWEWNTQCYYIIEFSKHRTIKQLNTLNMMIPVDLVWRVAIRMNDCEMFRSMLGRPYNDEIYSNPLSRKMAETFVDYMEVTEIPQWITPYPPALLDYPDLAKRYAEIYENRPQLVYGIVRFQPILLKWFEIKSYKELHDAGCYSMHYIGGPLMLRKMDSIIEQNCFDVLSIEILTHKDLSDNSFIIRQYANLDKFLELLDEISKKYKCSRHGAIIIACKAVGKARRVRKKFMDKCIGAGLITRMHISMANHKGS